MRYILYALVHLEASCWVLGLQVSHVSLGHSHQSCHKDFVGATLGRCIKPTYHLTMPFDARNAVFNGDYNDYGSNFYLVQGNDRTQGTDKYHIYND